MGKGISSQTDIGQKRCSKCLLVKPASEFRHRWEKGKVRARSQCKKCERGTNSVYNQTYYEKNRSDLIKAAAQWRQDNIEHYDRWQKAYQRRKHLEWKVAALKHYGERCACCGEAQFEFLTLDHVRNDGNVHREKMRYRNLYEWLYTRGFPDDFEIQTLCYNCNFAKAHNGGICPHQSGGSTTIRKE